MAGFADNIKAQYAANAQKVSNAAAQKPDVVAGMTPEQQQRLSAIQAQYPAQPQGGDDWFAQNAPPSSGGGGGLTFPGGDPVAWAKQTLQGMPVGEESLVKVYDALKAAGVDVRRPTRATGQLSSDVLEINGQGYDWIKNVDGVGGAPEWSLGGPMGAGGGSGGAGGGGMAIGDFGNMAKGYDKTFQAPSIEEIRNMPGYQFALEQGIKGLDARAAARGNVRSGGQDKKILEFATGLADQTAQTKYQNALGEYKMAYDIFRNDNNDIWGRYSDLANRGTNAANAATS